MGGRKSVKATRELASRWGATNGGGGGGQSGIFDPPSSLLTPYEKMFLLVPPILPSPCISIFTLGQKTREHKKEMT